MLARLVEADQAGPGAYVDMFALVEDLRQEIPTDWVFDARDALELRGLVHPLKVMGRTAPAKLTGEGRLYVEGGGQTGIIGDYRERPSTFVVVTGSGHQVAVGVEGDVSQASGGAAIPSEAWALLDRIELGLAEDEPVDDAQRHEALTDVRAAREQLQRRQPNRNAARALLEPLANLATVGELILRVLALLR